jgi:alpha-glucosidase (family GH31 glycosyl hydrolase)
MNGSGRRVTASVGPDARLRLARGDDTLLLGASPTVRAWRGEDVIPIQLSIEADEAGFVLEGHAAGADTVELRLELDSGRHWYGLGELLNQHWPLEDAAIQLTPFVTWDNGISGVADILEPLWLTATGVGVWIAPTAPNAFSMSLNAPPAGAPVAEWRPALNVTIPSAQRPNAVRDVGGDGLLALRFSGDRIQVRFFVGRTLREVQQRFVALVGHPRTAPSTRHLALPIWTTWARFKQEIDQSRCLQFVREIRAAGFPIGTLEIDNRWQTAYGDIEFDASRFPDPRRLIDQLHAEGIEVTAWLVPFINPAATTTLAEAAREGYLVRTPAGEPYLVSWWEGPGYLLDLSNPRAEAWFKERLDRLQVQTGLDGWKFDAGEACYFPADGQSAEPMTQNDYAHRYIDFVGRHFPGSDVRTSWRNQRATVLVREWDKFSLWGLDNGLQSVLSQALTLGMIGYPFVLADMVGGNEYDDQRTDGEMMVRWAQANALLPAIQYSLAPWDFGPEVSELCRRATELHVAFGPEFERLAAESVLTGAPIVRPLIWQFEGDRETETIWDQFMLGDRWLVAPVVRRGARQRDVYLPQGRWRDDSGTVHAGAIWLRDVPVPIDRLPYFERLREL